MAIEILPEPSIPITTPFRSGLGFLTATPIIAAATICLGLVIASAVLAPWLSRTIRCCSRRRNAYGPPARSSCSAPTLTAAMCCRGYSTADGSRF